MKKFTILIAAIALVCFAAPAMAVDWNFYGNARMATFYVSEDFGDGLNPAGTDDSDAELQWDLQGNSRFGANVKAENISARIEMGINESNVSARRVYGTWNFGSGTLKVGKDYTPVSQFISGQVYDGDLGLLGVGTQYGSRSGQIAFGFGGFEIALINPNTGLLSGMTTTATGALTIITGSGGATIPTVSVTTSSNGDNDQVLPKIEAGWGMSFDAWNFNLMGGFQYYSIEDVLAADGSGTDDIDVTSYTIGGDVGFNFGPGYVKGALSYGQNIGNANWGIPGAKGGTSGQGGLAQWDGDDDTNDTTTFQGALVGGLKVSDMLSFELGAGVRADRTDGTGVSISRDTAPWAVYLQSVIALAPGVYIIPEVGYYDYDNNTAGDDAGSLIYVGGKWQINF
jgi:hypothetical protein